MKPNTTNKTQIATLLFTIIALTHCIEWYQRGNPQFLHHSDFQKVVIDQSTSQDKVIFLKFFTPWCRYCRFLKEVFEKVTSESSYDEIKLLEINCDGEDQPFCSQMGVRSFPELMVYWKGQRQQRFSGFYPYPVIKELFEKYQNMRKDEQEKSKQPDQNQKPTESVDSKDQDYVQPQVVIPSGTQQNVEQDRKDSSVQKSNGKKQTVENSASNENSNAQVQRKKPEEVLQEEENIVEVDQNLEESQKEKQIVESLKEKDSETLNIVSDAQNNLKSSPYTKYLFYGGGVIASIVIFVKLVCTSDEDPKQSEHLLKSQQYGFSRDESSIKRVSSISIEDSQLNESLQFEHPESEEQQMHQVADEDL